MDNRDELKSAIRAFMLEHALGRENAIPRRVLMHHLRREMGYALSDRTLRRAYAELAIGFSCHEPKGLYWIETKADLNSTIAEQGAKARGCWARARKVEEAVKGPGRPQQMELGI